MSVRKKPEFTDTSSLMFILIGIIIIGIVLMALLRLQRGLLGIVLGVLAAFLIFYWIRELRKTIRAEWTQPAIKKPKEDWQYDVIEDDGEITVVAEVPGPEDQVKVTFEGGVLEIRGGSGFRKRMKIPRVTALLSKSYVNGVLNVKLKRQSRHFVYSDFQDNSNGGSQGF